MDSNELQNAAGLFDKAGSCISDLATWDSIVNGLLQHRDIHISYAAANFIERHHAEVPQECQDVLYQLLWKTFHVSLRDIFFSITVPSPTREAPLYNTFMHTCKLLKRLYSVNRSLDLIQAIAALAEQYVNEDKTDPAFGSSSASCDPGLFRLCFHEFLGLLKTLWKQYIDQLLEGRRASDGPEAAQPPSVWLSYLMQTERVMHAFDVSLRLARKSDESHTHPSWLQRRKLKWYSRVAYILTQFASELTCLSESELQQLESVESAAPMKVQVVLSLQTYTENIAEFLRNDSYMAALKKESYFCGNEVTSGEKMLETAERVLIRTTVITLLRIADACFTLRLKFNKSGHPQVADKVVDLKLLHDAFRSSSSCIAQHLPPSSDDEEEGSYLSCLTEVLSENDKDIFCAGYLYFRLFTQGATLQQEEPNSSLFSLSNCIAPVEVALHTLGVYDFDEFAILEMILSGGPWVLEWLLEAVSALQLQLAHLQEASKRSRFVYRQEGLWLAVNSFIRRFSELIHRRSDLTSRYLDILSRRLTKFMEEYQLVEERIS